MHTSSIRFIFGILGDVVAACLFLAPFPTFMKIIQNRSIEQFSGIPYVMALFNTLVSTWYGLPFVSSHNIAVLAINGFGVVVEGGYTLVFLIMAPRNEKIKIGSLLVLILLTFAVVPIVSLTKYHDDHHGRLHFCGIANAVSSSIMYLASLSGMLKVIQTKSVKYMPFVLSLFCFLCGIFWSTFGLLGHDNFIAVPNLIGCVVGAMQLIVYCIYNRNAEDENNIIADHSVEVANTHPSFLRRDPGLINDDRVVSSI